VESGCTRWWCWCCWWGRRPGRGPSARRWQGQQREEVDGAKDEQFGSKAGEYSAPGSLCSRSYILGSRLDGQHFSVHRGALGVPARNKRRRNEPTGARLLQGRGQNDVGDCGRKLGQCSVSPRRCLFVHLLSRGQRWCGADAARARSAHSWRKEAPGAAKV